MTDDLEPSEVNTVNHRHSLPLALRVLLLVCLLLVTHCSLLITAVAQSATATLSGTVEDQNGAVVPGATLTLINPATAQQRQTTTNTEGHFTFPLLQPGKYTLRAQHEGFKAIEVRDVALNVGDQKALQLSLPTGDVKETVNVTGEAPLINESPAVGTVVDRKFVENTPLNGRSFQDLISMTPGVVTQSPNNASFGVGSGGDFSINGQRTESNYYTVDGVSANNAPGNGGGAVGLPSKSGSVASATALGTTQALVSVDALQEFRVQSSSYSAEYGRAPGGQFSIITRSGTNSFHGTAFDYIRNNYFDANDWFNNSLGKGIPPLRQNDFGGTFGGPVLLPRFGEGGHQPGYNGRNRTFFFFSYEGLRLVQPQAATTAQLVPDMFMRQQAAPALQPILNAFPLPNGRDFGSTTSPSLAQFIQPYSLPAHIDSTSIRVDHTVRSKHSLFFRFSDTPTFSETRGNSGSISVLTTTSFNTRTYTLAGISQLSAHANNDFRLGYSTADATQAGQIDSFGGAVTVDLRAAVGAGSFPNARPQIQILIAGVGFAVLRGATSEDKLRQWNFVDTFSISSGHHQIKFGADYRRIVSPANPQSPAIVATYQNAQALVNNRTSLPLSVTANLSATPIFNEFAAFVQDDWRIGPRLNLSLGLRWEINPPPHGASRNDAFTLQGDLSSPSTVTLAPRGTPLWKTSRYNFAPRLGLVWTARTSPNWQTVVRAGGGVFFDTNNKVAATAFQGIGFGASATYANASLPLTSAQLALTPSVSPPFTSNAYIFPTHLQLPYTLEWNASVQQAMGSKQVVSVSYVGAAGRRLQGAENLSFRALNPNFGTIVYFRSGLTSNYHALQIQLQRSVALGVHALASYTWSHCLDFGSSDGSLPFIRGNCDMDVRHNVQGGLSWDLPGAQTNKFVQTLADHWGLDSRLIARTAFPVTLCGNQIIDPTTGNQFCAGLNLVTNQPVYLYGSQYPGGRAVNPAAFAIPTGTNIGNAPRNFVRGFGAWQINMALRREFPIHERLRLQFRAEAFNLFNHPNFGRIDPLRTSATFGLATAMLNQNLSTLASQYQQGGPRSMQFALKLVF